MGREHAHADGKGGVVWDRVARLQGQKSQTQVQVVAVGCPWLVSTMLL